jgi:cytoskeletal protein CcmA (bactofilin family)
MSTLPTSRAPEPVHHATDTYRASGSATIGKSVVIKGQIFSREDLVIDGEVEGSVEAIEHRVVVGPNGKVNAGVKAREIMVQGSIRGDVEAGDKIDIRREAKLVGNIKTQRIVIEDGAYFKGSVDIQRAEAAKAPAPAAAAAAPRPQTMAAAGGAPSGPSTIPIDPAKR